MKPLNLSMTKRGIVVADTALGKVNFGKEIIASVPMIKSLDLRRYLLYWDEIAWVTVNQRNVNYSSEIDVLSDEGIFKATYLPVYPLAGIEMSIWERISYAQLEVFRENNRRPNEFWSLDLTDINLLIHNPEKIERQGIEIELYNALPIAPAEVPVEAILKFKQHRKEELLRLRVTMNNLFDKVLNSQDIHQAISSSLDELRLALIDVDKVMKESFVKRLISSLSIKLDITGLLIGGIALSYSHQFPLEITTFLSALSALKITSGINIQPKEIPSNIRDYAYIYHVQSELSKKRRRHRK